MKPLLYIGATLMVGAGIYGFVDYNKASQDKEFRSLYTGEEKKEVKIPVETSVFPPLVTASLVAEKKETVSSDKKTVAVKRKTMKKKSRKMNSKMFSRAPLREEMEVPSLETPLPESLKKK
jgi:hypothetical protein